MSWGTVLICVMVAAPGGASIAFLMRMAWESEKRIKSLKLYAAEIEAKNKVREEA